MSELSPAVHPQYEYEGGLPDPATIGGSWGHKPTRHGVDFVWPGRAVLMLADRTWLSEPEQCTYDGPGEWMLDEQILICPGCGLDCT